LIIFTGCNSPNKSNNPTNSLHKNKPDSVSQNNSIPFKYLYAGFVLQDNVELPIGNDVFPIGTIVINTEKEWKDFGNKYLFYKNGDFAYMDIAYRFTQPVDFNKESIIYNSELSAKQDVYTSAYQIDKIEIQDNKPNVIIKDLDNFSITTMNYKGSVHRYIILLTINKSDLPKQ
jgi:hypothetical protein